jgi:uncharacterized protein YebE (UPF0316 family)
MQSFLESLIGAPIDYYAWVILPFMIFLARICDVTLGTIRIILVNRGQRRIAPLLGFVEVFIWIVAVGQLVQHLHSPISYFGYAAGFAVGNYVGMFVEDKLAIGNVLIRTIIQEGGEAVASALRQAGFGVTKIPGEGSQGQVHLIFTVVPRKDAQCALQIIRDVQPKAFITMEDVRSLEKGVFPARVPIYKRK